MSKFRLSLLIWHCIYHLSRSWFITSWVDIMFHLFLFSGRLSHNITLLQCTCTTCTVVLFFTSVHTHAHTVLHSRVYRSRRVSRDSRQGIDVPLPMFRPYHWILEYIFVEKSSIIRMNLAGRLLGKLRCI